MRVLRKKLELKKLEPASAELFGYHCISSERIFLDFLTGDFNSLKCLQPLVGLNVANLEQAAGHCNPQMNPSGGYHR